MVHSKHEKGTAAISNETKQSCLGQTDAKQDLYTGDIGERGILIYSPKMKYICY